MSENAVAEYGWSDAEGPESCGYIAPKILEILQRLKVGRVLDIGAGNGLLCSRLAASGYETVGVEYDAAGVEVAKRSHPGIPFYRFGVQDDPANLLAHEGPVDVVVSTEVVEHLFSPHLLPRYAAAVLKDGGYLIVTTPYHGYLKNLLLSLAGAWDKHHTPLWHGGHIKFWSRETLTELLNSNGFRVIEFAGVGRLPFLWKSMVFVARRT